MQEQSLALLLHRTCTICSVFLSTFVCEFLRPRYSPLPPSLLTRYLSRITYEKESFEFLSPRRESILATTMTEFIRDFWARVGVLQLVEQKIASRLAKHQRNIRESPILDWARPRVCSHRGNPRYTHLNVAFDPPHALFSLGWRRVRFVQRSDCRVASTPELRTENAIRK